MSQELSFESAQGVTKSAKLEGRGAGRMRKGRQSEKEAARGLCCGMCCSRDGGAL